MSTPFVIKNFFILVIASEKSKQGPIIIFCKQFKGIPTSIYGIGSPFLPMRNLDIIFFFILKSASNLNGNLNCSKELEHYSS